MSELSEAPDATSAAGVIALALAFAVFLAAVTWIGARGEEQPRTDEIAQVGD